MFWLITFLGKKIVRGHESCNVIYDFRDAQLFKHSYDLRFACFFFFLPYLFLLLKLRKGNQYNLDDGDKDDSPIHQPYAISVNDGFEEDIVKGNSSKVVLLRTYLL